jgi:hypothetical protein
MEGRKDAEAVEGEACVDKKSPKAMPFILLNIFGERFCSAGISGLTQKPVSCSPIFLSLSFCISNSGAVLQRETES